MDEKQIPILPGADADFLSRGRTFLVEKFLRSKKKDFEDFTAEAERVAAVAARYRRLCSQVDDARVLLEKISVARAAVQLPNLPELILGKVSSAGIAPQNVCAQIAGELFFREHADAVLKLAQERLAATERDLASFVKDESAVLKRLELL
jgi:hypothetical protein